MMGGAGSSVIDEQTLEEMTPLLRTPLQTIEAKIRQQLMTENEEVIRKEVAKQVDIELARIMGNEKAKGKGDPVGGRFEMDKNFAAYAARGVLTETWMPVVAQLSEGEELNDKTVARAVESFLNGFPLLEDVRSGSIYGGLTDERLLSAMKAADQKATLDPHARSAIRNYVNYIIGQGVKVSCIHSPDIDSVVRGFWKTNDMDRRARNAVARRMATGEHFYFYFIDDDTGDIILRDRCRPWEIAEIETHSDDAETRFSYGRQVGGIESRDPLKYYADIKYFEQLERSWKQYSKYHGKLSKLELVQMTRHGELADVRGVTPMLPVLRYHRYYDDFLIDRIILNHERSKVVWVKVVRGQGSTESSRTDLGPQGGQVLIQTPFLEWKAINANINSSDAREDGRLIRLTIAAGWGQPEHILFQDASNAVYSSLHNHDTPWAQNVRSYQNEWRWDYNDMMSVVVREKIARGKLPETTKVEVMALEAWGRLYVEVASMIQENAKASEIRNTIRDLVSEAKGKTRTMKTEDVEVDVRFPDPVQEDPLKQAQRIEVLMRNFVMSVPEAAGTVGLNWEEQDQLQKRAGGWEMLAKAKNNPTNGKAGGKETDEKPGELTTTDPEE